MSDQDLKAAFTELKKLNSKLDRLMKISLMNEKKLNALSAVVLQMIEQESEGEELTDLDGNPAGKERDAGGTLG